MIPDVKIEIIDIELANIASRKKVKTQERYLIIETKDIELGGKLRPCVITKEDYIFIKCTFLKNAYMPDMKHKKLSGMWKLNKNNMLSKYS